MAGKADSVKTIFYALGANFAIFVAKLVAAIITGSGSMLAEAVHSLADCGNQGLLLLGLKRAKAPPSPDFPLGFGKAIYFWSFLVALMLFSVGGMFSIYEGMHKLQHPEPLKWAWLAVGVLTFGIIAEGFSILLRVLSPITPHITHALWQELGYGEDILSAPWPQVDESALVQDELELVLQINGKLRGSIKVAATADKAAIEAIAVASEVAQQHLNGGAPKKVVVVPGRLVNIVC